MQKPLGKLVKVDVREYWGKEAHEFTPWLSMEENLRLLGESLGLELELTGTEQCVGEFSADIVARDSISGESVIIENQLERSNHDHLGKLLTYASGLEAKTVVWVAREIRDEHRQALNWLNDITNEEINFFGIEVELWRIDGSLPAPKFNVVSRPSIWRKEIGSSVLGNEGATTGTKALQFEFWKGFREFCKDKGTSLRLERKPHGHYYLIALGRFNIFISLTVTVAKNRLSCEVYMLPPQSRSYFPQIESQREQIESELGTKLQWDPPGEQGGRGRIAQFRSANIESRDNWLELFIWLKERAESFQKIFSPRVKLLSLDEETVQNAEGDL